MIDKAKERRKRDNCEALKLMGMRDVLYLARRSSWADAIGTNAARLLTLCAPLYTCALLFNGRGVDQCTTTWFVRSTRFIQVFFYCKG
jgi:hypothetical protein